MNKTFKSLAFMLTINCSLTAGNAIAGLDEGFAAYNKKDYASAMREWLPLANRGDAVAQTNVGALYDNGEGVLIDHQEAMKWHKLSAAQGYATAQANIGLMYQNGRGVRQDHEESFKWFLLAANQGNAAAQASLGYKYANGVGVQQDYKESVRWYRLAADQGNAYAQVNLGLAYEKGNGVPQSDVEAVNWYGRAADQGDASAKVALKKLTDVQTVINLRGTPGYCQSDSESTIFWKKVSARAAVDLAKDPNDFGAMYCLASIMFAQKNWSELLPMAAKMEKIASRYEMGGVHVFYQEYYRTKGDMEKVTQYASAGSPAFREIGAMAGRGGRVVNVNAHRK